VLDQGAQAFRKDAKSPSMAGSARAITHLIPEVRPQTGQRFALFKNAPGVFVPVPRCFATGLCSPRFKFICCLLALFGACFFFCCTDIGVTDKLSPFRNLNNFSSQVVSQRADNVSDNLQGEK